MLYLQNTVTGATAPHIIHPSLPHTQGRLRYAREHLEAQPDGLVVAGLFGDVPHGAVVWAAWRADDEAETETTISSFAAWLDWFAYALDEQQQATVAAYLRALLEEYGTAGSFYDSRELPEPLHGSVTDASTGLSFAAPVWAQR